MSDIHSTFIDFRSEHRLYLTNGVLHELVGMLVDTDYDEWEDTDYSEDSCPVTWYKFIFNSEYMYHGGHFREGDLPPIFAHRGDALKVRQVILLLFENMFYNIDHPSIVLEDDLPRHELTCQNDETVCDITVFLSPSYHSYCVDTNYCGMLCHVSFPEGHHEIVLSYNSEERHFSYKRLARALGQIVYALREFFKREVEIVDIIRNVYTKQGKTVRGKDLPGVTKFLRLVEFFAREEVKEWDESAAEGLTIK